MLKAEATDLKRIPVLYDFDIEKTNSIFNKSLEFKAESVNKNIESELQKEIDDLVFDYLDVNEDLRKEIINYFVYLVSIRCDKSKS